ncbi:MAG: replisome organizer [Clostridia bacterium]|nr:replisome organizer [Clostridia bacterium]
MAERRMFAKTIIGTEVFLDMPLSTQALYFHLSMRADDEGFVGCPRKIQRMIGASDDDLKVLIAKKFLIPFESGVVVIRHWKIHNYIQKDRFRQTEFREEREQLSTDERGLYTECIQFVSKLDTQDRVGKDRVVKDRLGEDRVEKEGMLTHTEERKRFQPPTVDEVSEYCADKDLNVDAGYFVDYYTAKGWMIGREKMKDWKAAARNWDRRGKPSQKTAEEMHQEYLDKWRDA